METDNKKLYGVGALFTSPNKVSEAAAKIAEKGYQDWDVHSSYPIHGMPKKMKLKWSPLGYFALIFGLTGTSIGLFLTYWTMSVDYPMIIGGKPSFSLPAFIPVLFELTVLLAAVGTALSMLFVLFKFPNNRHPLHDTDYMKEISVDKSGILIEASDKLFNREEVIGVLSQLGADKVIDLYLDSEEVNYKPKILEPKFLIFLIIVAFGVSLLGYFVNNKLLFMPPFDFMVDQQRLDVQSKSDFFADGFGGRQPVEETVARGQTFYPYKGKPELAEANLINTLASSEEVLALGKRKYNTFCSPCHDYHGTGNGRLNGQFPNPPSLHSEKVRNWKDGNIYHIIVEGQNIMPSYALQLTEDERWSVIHYIRALQRSMNAKEEDLK